MAVDNGFEGRLTGLDDTIKALLDLVPKLRVRAIRNSLAAGARVFRDEAKRLTPVLFMSVRRRGQVIRKPGTVRNAIRVRTSKAARRAGDVGVFVNVKPAKSKGTFNPDDPYYWRWLEFGRQGRGAAAARVRVKSGGRSRRLLRSVGPMRPFRFLQSAFAKSAQALAAIVAALGPAVQKFNQKDAAP